jgi:hypothetical protein
MQSSGTFAAQPAARGTAILAAVDSFFQQFDGGSLDF